MKKITGVIILILLCQCFITAFTYNSTDELKNDLDKYGRDPIVYTNAGIFYLMQAFGESSKKKQQKLLDAAIKYLEEAYKIDQGNSKTISYLGTAYGTYCGVIENLPEIMKYSNKSMGYLNAAVENEPYSVEFRMNRARSFIFFPSDYFKLSRPLLEDTNFVINYLEKDILSRRIDFYYRDSRAEMYYIRGQVYDRKGDKKEAKENYLRSKEVIYQYRLNPSYAAELEKKLKGVQ